MVFEFSLHSILTNHVIYLILHDVTDHVIYLILHDVTGSVMHGPIYHIASFWHDAFGIYLYPYDYKKRIRVH